MGGISAKSKKRKKDEMGLDRYTVDDPSDLDDYEKIQEEPVEELNQNEVDEVMRTYLQVQGKLLHDAKNETDNTQPKPIEIKSTFNANWQAQALSVPDAKLWNALKVYLLFMINLQFSLDLPLDIFKLFAEKYISLCPVPNAFKVVTNETKWVQALYNTPSSVGYLKLVPGDVIEITYWMDKDVARGINHNKDQTEGLIFLSYTQPLNAVDEWHQQSTKWIHSWSYRQGGLQIFKSQEKERAEKNKKNEEKDK